MLIVSVTPQEQEVRNILNRQFFEANKADYIRRNFDRAITSAEAESWITIAKEQGLNDLAAEMESDLQDELLTA